MKRLILFIFLLILLACAHTNYRELLNKKAVIYARSVERVDSMEATGFLSHDNATWLRQMYFDQYLYWYNEYSPKIKE